MPSQQDSEVRQRIADFSAAWSRHDGNAMGQFFADEGSLIDPWGREARGMQEVQQFFTELHSTGGKHSRNQLTVSHIDWLKSDVCVVDCEGELTGMTDPKGNELPPTMHHLTLTMTKQGGTWLIAAARPVIYGAGQGQPAREYPAAG